MNLSKVLVVNVEDKLVFFCSDHFVFFYNEMVKMIHTLYH